MTLTWAPGRQHISLRLRAGLQMGPSVPLIRELPTTTTLFSFLAEAVSTCGVDCLTLGNLLGEPSHTFSVTSPSVSSAANLLLRETWGCKVGRRGLPMISSRDPLPVLPVPQVPPPDQQRQAKGSTTDCSAFAGFRKALKKPPSCQPFLV